MTLGCAAKKVKRLAHGHLQHVVNILLLVAHVEHAALVARAAALLADQFHVGQKAHFHGHGAVALARFAAAAGNIEGKMPGSEPALFRFRRGGENFADGVERLQIGRGIRARRPADGRLVHHLDCRERRIAFEPVAEFAPVSAGALGLQRFVEHVVHQRRFPRAGNAGDGHEHAQRDHHVHALQIVAVRAENFQELALRLAAPRRHRDVQIAAQITAGERMRVGQHCVARARKNQLAAVLACARAEIENMVGGENRVGIVLHHQQRVSQVAQAFQNLNQAVGVARVQPDRRLIQHVERAHEVRTQRRGQLDALRLAAGKRGSQPVERQIVEPDFVEESQALLDFFQNFVGDRGFGGAQLQALEETGALPSPSSGRLR